MRLWLPDNRTSLRWVSWVVRVGGIIRVSRSCAGKIAYEREIGVLPVSDERAPDQRAPEDCEPEESVDPTDQVDQIDPAAVALARVRSAARSGSRRGKSSQPGRRRSDRGAGPGFSGPGPDGRDPKPLGRAVDSWADDLGVQAQLTVAGLTARWSEIVGDLVASHVTADEYHRLPQGGRLVVTADSPGWESSMNYQVETIKRRIAEELGSGLVTVIEVRTAGRSRRRGWRVQSGRRR